MAKNVSGKDDAIANIALPINQFADIRNIAKNGALASRLEKYGEVKIGDMRIWNAKEKGDTGFVRFKYKKSEVAFYYESRKRLAETLGMINDEFIREESNRLDVKGKDVVDIGAYVADTAICFVSNGAKRVYAFEPYPYFYNLGIKNIKANGLESKITMVNAGCGGESTTTNIESSSTNFTSVKSGKQAKMSSNQIKIMSLEQVANRYKLKNAALKIDCEGCEYGILFKTKPEVLRRFSEIQIEYHYGYDNLEKRLVQIGFTTVRTKPMKKYNFTSKSFMVIGFLNAKRKENYRQ